MITKRLTFIFACLTMMVNVAFSQTKVTGTVVSQDDGYPIMGASVRIVGTDRGIATDSEGKFTLTMPEGHKELLITYVGYEERKVKASNGMKVTLRPDETALNEVVVTAMGVSRDKKALGYASQDVKADKLTEAASTSLSSALQGKVSGVEIAPSSGMPGASSKITIRGSRSFTGDNTPLYVVDGMPIASTADISTGDNDGITGTDFANRSVDIDPNDIESINILKGQAASALYGMRASNGVIIITTKSGKRASMDRPEITVTSNLSCDVVSTRPDYQTEYAQGSNGTYKPTASTSWGPKISELANDPTYGGNVANSYTNDGQNLHPGMYYVKQRADAGLDPWATPRSYDNTGDFFRTGVTWSNNVNVAQAFDKGHYSFSIGNTLSEGIIPSTGLTRYNARVNTELRLSKHWTTGFRGNYINSKIKKQPSANDGLVATVYGAPASYDLAGIPSAVPVSPSSQISFRNLTFDNPYWSVNNNRFEERSHRFFGNAFGKYNTHLADNMTLDVKYQLGIDSYTTNYNDLWAYGHKGDKGEIHLYDITINEINSLLTANYTWKIKEDMNFQAMVGNEIVDKNTKYVRSDGYNFNFAGWNHLNNSSVRNGDSWQSKKRTFGLFANLSFDWKNMLFLNVTGRNDIVSTMPRGNRSFFYPSVSAGFIFTELEALKNDVLTYGKVRASYAEVGQAGEYVKSYYEIPIYGGAFSTGIPIQYPIGSIVAYHPSNVIYNPNLKPQNTRSYEVGLDLGFWNGRISFSYTYSRQNVKNQIFEVPLDPSTGYQREITNAGSMHTNAHEITLGVKPIVTRNCKWDLEFNFSKINNYVDELAPGVESIFLGGFVDPQVRANIGDKFPVIYGTKFLRNANGDIVVDENGMPQSGGNGVIGKVSPDFTLGISTSVELYKWRLSAVLDWKKGGQIYCGTLCLLDYYGVTQHSADLRNSDGFYFERTAVKANGDGTYSPNDILIPSTSAFEYLNIMSSISEGGIRDNGFLKLREISLSYPVLEKPWLKIRLNAFARNILLWSALKGLDPESTQGNDNMSGAFERFSLPGTTSIGFGATLKF